MAYVSNGPVATMPGNSLSLPEGTMCDDHPDRLAVKRIQGETDSMGCEAADMCQECLDKYREAVKAHAAEAATGRCDWCGQHKTTLAKRRDYDEGFSGRLYDVCLECRLRDNEAARAELAEYDYSDCDWDTSL